MLGFKTGKKKDLTVGALLDAMDGEAIVVRGKNCEIVAANSAAMRRMAADEGSAAPGCRKGFAAEFPKLCAQCPVHTQERLSEPARFQVEDKSGRAHEASLHQIDWTDGKSAVLLVLRDIQQHVDAEKRLYSLAYNDHLTGAPNRQRLREDFDAIAERVEDEALQGMLSIFDIDNFKAVNDTYGHNAGDIMLSRLVDYLESVPELKGKIYRLGGDEFVLLYYEEATGRPLAELHEQCESLLDKALRPYTLPNIEITCTISMGAAMFPMQGVSYSELLRKADIALYKAKENGRNQYIFFEDKYDTAKKFKDLYINIQPVLLGAGNTYGYELIDKGEDIESGDAVSLLEANRTLDALGLENLQSDDKYFITYTRQLLGKTAGRNLPRDKFIIMIQLPEEIKPTDISLYRELRKAGYNLAMSGLRESNATEEIFSYAQIFRFDSDNTSPAVQNRLLRLHAEKIFIAERVNSQRDYDIAKRRGFKLFQGYYFEEPPVVVKKTKELEPMKFNYLRLLQLTSTDDYVDFKEISNVIASDVVLSYKLLKLLNSTAMGLRYRISSIEMAVSYLGEINLKKWIAMLALRGIVQDKPLELMRVSLIRARFGELLAPLLRPRRDERHVFMTGMFSLLHIALEKTKEELLEEIPMADDIRESLLTRHGVHSDLLTFFSHYEYANWDEVARFAEANRLEAQTINQCYIDAVRWYNGLTESAG